MSERSTVASRRGPEGIPLGGVEEHFAFSFKPTTEQVMQKKPVEIIDVDYDLQRVTFTIDPHAVWQIDEIAEREGKSRSEIFRRGIYQWLAEEKFKNRKNK